MTFLKDLGPCTYLPLSCEALVAVGWLGRDSEFEKGAVTEEFVRKLSELTREPWQPVVSAGFHSCDLCQFDGPRSTNNVFIPFKAKIYVAPTAIVHYIKAHWYRPPELFIEAVLACPAMKSMEYKKALLANGGRSLV